MEIKKEDIEQLRKDYKNSRLSDVILKKEQMLPKVEIKKELPIVSLEQAVRLKALGFDWKPTAYYDFTITAIAAPTVALALKWMRNETKILFYICPLECVDGVIYCTCHSGKDHTISNSFIHQNYEDAESYLLNELLTILEKEKK
ncbi:MAG: hypothetical protein LBE11_00170 [Prevotellaceae bacterium]|jgi:hypothetical protein|nr:hypothetical protein [Prevotellaceae bacterium]